MNVLFQAPYLLGPSMLIAVIAKDEEKGVDALFEDPPVADASFVTPSTLLDHRKFQTIARPALQAGEKRSGKACQDGRGFFVFRLLRDGLAKNVPNRQIVRLAFKLFHQCQVAIMYGNILNDIFKRVGNKEAHGNSGSVGGEAKNVKARIVVF